MKYLFLLSFVLCTAQLLGQEGSFITPQDTIILDKKHSAKKATILSALAPGAGQIYNKKYWKAPIVWGGLGVCAYFISDNRKFVKLYRGELANFLDNPDYVSTVIASDGSPATSESLENALDQRKTWLDLSYFSFIGVYGLNILDANVDGHLFEYDISPDISMKIEPTNIFSHTAQTGIKLSFHF